MKELSLKTTLGISKVRAANYKSNSVRAPRKGNLPNSFVKII